MAIELAHPSMRDRAYSLRFNHPCPICGGGQDGHNSHGTQCTMGFESEDGRYAHCGAIPSGHPDKNGQTWAHRRDGPCDCGEPHGTAPRLEIVRTPAKPNTGRIHRRYPPIATHEYQNLDGSIRFRVTRLYRGHAKPAHYPEDLPKTIPQRPDGRGDWYNGLDGAPYEGVYRLPQLVASDIWEPVFVVGGELCADAVAEAGGVATCNAGGEGPNKWRDWYSEYFRGRNVVILADADKPGREHAHAAADALAGYASTVRVVELNGAHDVADWLDAGHTLNELRAIAAAAPIIAARMVETLNSTHDLQDGRRVEGAHDCPNCQRWQEEARVAQTSLENLRAQHARESRLMAISNDKLSAPVKLAAIALERELREGNHQNRERDNDGRPRIYQKNVADRIGAAPKSVGPALAKIANTGLYTRYEDKRFGDTAHFWDATGPTAPEDVPTPVRDNGWGGKRVKCESCGSDNLETQVIHRLKCRDCGSITDKVVSRRDTNGVDPEPDGEGPQTLNSTHDLQDGRRVEEGIADDAEQPLDSFSSQYLIAAQLPARVQDDPRVALLALAEQLDWPALQIAPHISPLGERGWGYVAHTATDEQIQTAHAALVTRQQAALCGGEGE